LACSSCGKDLPIVNKKYDACANCNSIRLTGKSLQERQAESSLKYKQNAFDRFRQKVTQETDDYTQSGIRSFKSAKKSPIGYKPIKQQTLKGSCSKRQALTN
jgi:DNA-directed RNA polymerase subunit RPC12/RpoP